MQVKDFKKLTIQDAAKYLELYKQNLEKISDTSFTNIFAWQDFYNLECYFTDTNCFIYKNQMPASFWLPSGDYSKIDYDEFYELVKGKCLERIPESFVQILQEKYPNKLTVIEERGLFDYIYHKDDLSNLAGNRYHKKKNHVNGFIKSYGVDYRKFSDEVIEDVLALQEEWCKWHDCKNSPSLLAENSSIIKILVNYDKIPNLIGGALYAEGKMVAYTIAEALDNEQILIHFEKGHNDYRGVYQAINQIFLQNEASNFTLVNREQDMGEEGLRKAKESYYPCNYIKKYKVKIAGA